MTTRVLIVDDEPLARRAIRRLLDKRDGIEIVGECGDGESAVRLIRELAPDLVFLDIQMPEMDGFAVIREVGANAMPVTIFVTAHDRFAVRAFDAHAADYVLKPIARARFDIALTRAKQRIAGELDRAELRRVLASLERIAASRGYLDRLAVPDRGRIHFVAVRDIDWLEAQGNYVVVHARGRDHDLRETLAKLEDKLDPADFVRIHRSTIVNVHRIREIQPWFHGHHRVVLEDGTELRMSRYQREVAKRLGLA
jgi:two-component system, LytTR family, response regulator